MSENEIGLLSGIKKNARMAVLMGILLVICGLLAIGSPFTAGVSVTLIVGAVLIVSGLGQCFLAFQAGAFGEGMLMFLMGLLTAFIGFYVFRQPVAGLAAITLFLAAYFVVTGIFELVAAFQSRPADGWGLMLFNGIITLILGVIIWRQFPVSGAWAVGLLFGIKLFMSGLMLIMVGRAVRGAATDAQDHLQG